MIIHKAAVATGDGLDFVLSDETKDRMGDIIEASGWQLANFKKNPIALFGHDQSTPIGRWENLRVEGTKLIGRLKLAARGTSQRIDEIVSLIEQGILKAVSVGFKPIEQEPIGDGRGIRFKRHELLETSVVSVPANPSALAVAKSMNISEGTMRQVFGENAVEDALRLRATGKPAEKATPVRGTPMSLSEKIESAQNELTHLRDQLAEATKADQPDPDLIDDLNEKVETKKQQVEGLKRSEANLLVSASETRSVIGTVVSPSQTPSILKRSGYQKKEVSPIDLFLRRAAVHTVAAIANKGIDQALEQLYPDRDEATDIIAKAAVAGATTTTSGWAAELVNTVNTAWLETLRPMSVYPALADAGNRLTFDNQNGIIRIPSRSSTPSIAGSFVGEGAPIPVRRLGLGSMTISPKKLGVISVFSREIARYGAPAIEGLLREEITADTAITIDSLLFDNTAGSATRPAGLLNGVSALTATAGGGYAAILGDINKLIAPFEAANAGQNIVLVMPPAKARAIRFTPGPDGTFGWADSLLSGMRIVTSTSITANRIIAIDANDFVTATGDVPEFDLSDQAVLHMEDTTPLQIGTAGSPNTVAAPVQSMFQTAQVAIRMLMDLTWGMRRTGMVQYIDSVTW